MVISKRTHKESQLGIVQVAAAAKVSTATVDRVLNNRGGVREITQRRVLKAALELGYIEEDLVTGKTGSTAKKIIFLLPSGTNPYLIDLGSLIRSDDCVPPAFNMSCACHLFKGFDPHSLARAIRTQGKKGDGLAVMGIEHPVVREAINQMTGQGTPVVTFVTDVSHCDRASFVGLDNRAAGRTAAFLLGRLCGHRKGGVALIAGSLSYLAHNDREMGFLSLMQESFPGFRIVGVREGHDDPEENFTQTMSLLDQHPDLVGIYNIGGSSGGVGRALAQAGKSDSVVLIGHGLSEDTRALLVDGTMDVVITQDPLCMIQDVGQIFSNIFAGLPPVHQVPELAMRIVTRENLP